MQWSIIIISLASKVDYIVLDQYGLLDNFVSFYLCDYTIEMEINGNGLIDRVIQCDVWRWTKPV